MQAREFARLGALLALFAGCSDPGGSEGTGPNGPALWSARTAHTSLTFRDGMWVLGGLGSRRLNDVWRSSDGTDWTGVTADADWVGRQGHTSVVFDERIWVIDGRDTANVRLNDAWHSIDGELWIDATASAP